MVRFTVNTVEAAQFSTFSGRERLLVPGLPGFQTPNFPSFQGFPRFPGYATSLWVSGFLTTGQVVTLLRFETAVQEVFAVTVLPGRRYPELINDDEKLLENSFAVPDAGLADVPAALRALAKPTRGAAGSAGNGSGPRERS